MVSLLFVNLKHRNISSTNEQCSILWNVACYYSLIQFFGGSQGIFGSASLLLNARNGYRLWFIRPLSNYLATTQNSETIGIRLMRECHLGYRYHWNVRKVVDLKKFLDLNFCDKSWLVIMWKCIHLIIFLSVPWKFLLITENTLKSVKLTLRLLSLVKFSETLLIDPLS